MEKAIKYDVVVIGSGIAGSIISAIFARNGVKTLMIDRGRHPRFAIGESMIPGTSYMLRIMADRYGVPELDHISTFLKLRRFVTSSSGIKRNFSFVHHKKGSKFDPKKSTMLPVPHHPHGPEAHLMRQDVDAHMFGIAIRYGADALQNVSIKDIMFSSEGVEVETQCGKKIQAKYIVDASGYESAIAKKLNLRDTPTRYKTHSRSIFTHMVGVGSFDSLYGKNSHDLPQPLSQGTLHHIFDGGWLWVIPFNNYESSTNPLCSVGLQLDPRKYPETNKTPEQEFAEFLADYPEIAAQFTNAKAVRAWVSAPRLQYSSKQIVGERFCLLAHAAGFIDPLFSRGLYVTMESINALAHRVIDLPPKNSLPRVA